MSGRTRPTKRQFGKLTPDDVRLIDFVLDYAEKHDRIPRMDDMARALGVTRQGVLVRMEFMAKYGLLYERPRYAVHWFALTEVGERAYIEEKHRATHSLPV